MSDNSMDSSKKFPYLVLPTNSPAPFENIDGLFSSRGRVGKDNQSKRDASNRGRGHVKNEQQPSGTSYPSPTYMSYMMEDTFHSHANIIAHSGGQVPLGEFSTPISSISMSQMKAILTAQKELRKPAGSLYPSESQISLIPETEMIYKKYFPNEGGSEPKSEKTSSRNKGLDNNSRNLLRNDHHINSKDGKSLSASLSFSESTIATVERNKKSDCNNKNFDESEGTSGKRVSEGLKTLSNNEKQTVLKQRDAEARFRKRVQAQLVSLCGEVERQSSELNDMKRELKELLHMSRKNATDNDSSKSRLDTLSKHVHEIDNKMDTIQESVSGQEKSLLNKLMLLGEMSDSDSELDDAAVKSIGALSSPSATKLISTAKRPYSPGSSSDCLPKSCYNWVPIAPDFDKLIQAVALINYRMDRNQSMKLCTTNSGATFKHSDVIDLTLFKNGIILGSTGFRSYSTMSIIRFVNEIFNGYLPTELSTQYPDGVVIVLTDKRSIVHSYDETFTGTGTKLSGKHPPDLLPGAGTNVLQKKESAESLKSTITSLISLSSHSRKSSVTNISKNYELLPELKLGQGETVVGAQVNQKIITLKLNETKNGNRYKLKVPVRATIKVVTDHISKVLAEKDGGSAGSTNDYSNFNNFMYDIILPVPHGRLSCTSSTLEDYGLIQNTLVYLQEQI